MDTAVRTHGLSSYLLYISRVAGFAAGMGRGRRSNVVKEVERLKKNREERRQRQAELKEEKEVLMSMDPGNPNWEFLAMIRCVPDPTPGGRFSFRLEILSSRSGDINISVFWRCCGRLLTLIPSTRLHGITFHKTVMLLPL
jgi:hypothetical protein